MTSRLLFVSMAALTLSGGPAYATVYLSVEQAQALIFPGATFQPETRTLTDEQAKAIERASGTNVRLKQLKLWRVSTGGWFIVDEVVGKHDFIPFALGIDTQGTVKGLELLEYREAYGGQVRDPEWRKQFLGKQPNSKLQLEKDVRNISGATLSCKHITDGVHRLLVTYDLAIKTS